MINKFEKIGDDTFEAKGFEHIPVDHIIDETNVTGTVMVWYTKMEDTNTEQGDVL